LGDRRVPDRCSPTTGQGQDLTSLLQATRTAAAVFTVLIGPLDFGYFLTERRTAGAKSSWTFRPGLRHRGGNIRRSRRDQHGEHPAAVAGRLRSEVRILSLSSRPVSTRSGTRRRANAARLRRVKRGRMQPVKPAMTNTNNSRRRPDIPESETARAMRLRTGRRKPVANSRSGRCDHLHGHGEDAGIMPAMNSCRCPVRDDAYTQARSTRHMAPSVPPAAITPVRRIADNRTAGISDRHGRKRRGGATRRAADGGKSRRTPGPWQSPIAAAVLEQSVGTDEQFRGSVRNSCSRMPPSISRNMGLTPEGVIRHPSESRSGRPA